MGFSQARAEAKKIQPLIISQVNEWEDFDYLLIRTEGLSLLDLKWDIEKILTEEDPGSPIQYRLLSDSFENQYRSERNLNVIFFVLAVIAILISSLGSFGLATYSTQSRSREIGIRKVNGAVVQDILFRFYRELLVWIGVAFLVAAPVSVLVMNNWLTNFEYKTKLSVWVIIGGGLITLLIGVISISLATIRDASRNPADTLRTE